MTRVAVVEPDGGGGLIHYAYQLSEALAAAGAEVTLHTSRHYELGHLPHRALVRAEMRLWPAIERRRGALHETVRRLRRPWRGFRYCLEWRRLTVRLLEERPDLAVFSTIRFPFLVRFLQRLRRAGIPLAQVCHEFQGREKGGRRPWRRLLASGAHTQFDRVFVHGDTVRSTFLAATGIDPSRVVAIPHGDEGMFASVAPKTEPVRDRYGIGADEPLALFFGGLRPSKGIEDLIDAFATVSRSGPGRLLIVGQPAGIDPQRIAARMAKSAPDRIVFDPRYVPLDEVGALFSAADVVVLPYRSAAGSGVLQLAFTFGRPVVATKTGGFLDDVRDGVDGILVPPGSVSDLAAAVGALLSDPARARRMGRAARDASKERHGWDIAARKILSLGVVA